MDKVVSVIKDICNDNHCRTCPMADRGICKAKQILKLFEKYWG